MKKWLALSVGVLLVLGLWWVVRTYARFVPEQRKPKYGTVTRGDIRVPIAASGLIEPTQRIEVKSKASGTVLKVSVQPGQFVRSGDVLVVLQKTDEQRTVDRTTADKVRAEALLAQSQVAVRRAEVAVDTAQARVAELTAQLRIAESDRKTARDAMERTMGFDKELITAEANYDMAAAQLRSAWAALESSLLSIEDTRQVVITNEQAVAVAVSNLGDAMQRLKETTVFAPQDALVTTVNVAEGTVIQSATQAFTGGTLVLELADISQLKVVARVDEADYGRVLEIAPAEALPQMDVLHAAATSAQAEIQTRTGTVKLTVDAFPDQNFTGRIERVEPQGKLNAGSSVIQFDVHIIITDPNRTKLLLGTQTQVEFTIDSASNVLRIPAEAVKTNADQRGVWVHVAVEDKMPEEYGKRFVPCTFGITDGTYTEVAQVRAGFALQEGDEVFTKLPTAPKEND